MSRLWSGKRLSGGVLVSVLMMLCAARETVPCDVLLAHEPGGCAIPHPTLDELARTHGKVIGTAYRSTFELDDPCYREMATTEFGSLTTEIGSMMNVVEPAPGVYSFKEADSVAALAARTHKRFNLHALVWDPLDQQAWGIVPAAVRSLDAQHRHEVMIEDVTDVMKHFAGRTSTVTVVNEAFDQMGNLQHNTWWDITKSDQYIFDSFRAARLADPTAQLYYNDHSSETHSDKSNAVYALVKRLRESTVQVMAQDKLIEKPLIDGIGFQAHLLGGENQQPSTLDIESNLQRFADLGLNIQFTEVDVRIPVRQGKSDQADLDRQGQVYRTVTNLCLKQPKCVGITFWGFTDKRSWITDYPDTFSGYGSATIMTKDYRIKPAWSWITNTLRAGDMRTPS